MKKSDIQTFFERFKAHNPAPETELEYTNTYTLLVAVVLSAQMTDTGVNKATKALFPIADTPEKMLALGEDKVKDYLKSINYYNTKTKNVLALSRMLIDEFEGQVPDTREDLMRLPGVGRKTANVVLNVAFDRTAFPVDTHIFRVSNRTGLAPGKTPEDVEKKLLKVVPEEYGVYAHHWLILHGRYVCKARKPLCEECSVADLCAYLKSEKKKAETA